MAKKLVFTQKNKTISYGSFLCKDGCIVYKIVRKPEANLFLEYKEEDRVYIVTCNKSISLEDIQTYVKNNYEWVLNWYKNVDDPAPWFIFGKKVPVKVIIGNAFKTEYLGDKINVYLKHKRDYKIAVVNFYKAFSHDYLKNRTLELINLLGLKGSFGEVKWFTGIYGRCWAKANVIDLAAGLVQYSKEFIDSVIYHEIAHFTYANHRREFWNLLEKYCPDYRKQNGYALTLRMHNHMW